jgi:hypothetical protein
VQLLPRTSTITLRSEPAGLTLGLGGETAVAPFTRTVIVGSRNTISAPLNQTQKGKWYFTSWSDGLGATHDVTATGTPGTYTATYRKRR